MNRIVATGFVVLSLLCAGCQAAQTDGPSGPAGDPEAARAVEQAREALARHTGSAPSEFNVTRVEPRQWSDTSLGCRRPGSMYAQVISEGHAVLLERAGKTHEVHVSGAIVVICDSPTDGASPRMPARARGLTEASARARQDLARKLRMDEKEVRVVKMEPQRWADGRMDCVNETSDTRGAVSGYRLHLNAAGRVYTYHTDLDRVIACPPIEEQ
jgi:hypothetical protein